jgi:hypothetical protein
MFVSKLLEGVIVIDQGRSRRAIRPKFLHRIMLVWVFRYFASLPMVVLARWQKMLVGAVIAQGRVVPVPGGDSGVIIGTVENAASPGVEQRAIAPAGGWEYARQHAARHRASA